MSEKFILKNGSVIETIETNETVRSNGYKILGIDLAKDEDYTIYYTVDRNGKVKIVEGIKSI